MHCSMQQRWCTGGRYVCLYIYAFLVQFFVWEMVKVVAVARLPFGGNWQCRHSPSYSKSQSYIHSKSLARITRSARRVLNLVSATSAAAAADAREFSLPSDLLTELIICLACLQFPLRSFHYALTTDCQVYYCFRFAYELPKARRLLHGYPEHPVPLLPFATIYQPCAACSVQRDVVRPCNPKLLSIAVTNDSLLQFICFPWQLQCSMSAESYFKMIW